MNKVISKPALYAGENFAGRTVLDWDWDGREPTRTLRFEDCVFTGDGPFNGSYALYVPFNRRPRAEFRRCTFRWADKAALAHWCAFFDCIFEECEDGVHDPAIGYLHVERCKFRDMGTSSPTHHPDCVQSQGGKFILVRDCEFDLPLGNSWVFLESKHGRIERCRIMGNRGIGAQGPTYCVYLWDDGAGTPTRCWIDHNQWDAYQARLPVAYNFAGGELMIGPHNMEPD